MKEQLRQARSRNWCHSGVIPCGTDQWGEFASINERRSFEGLRFAANVRAMRIKPSPIRWIDASGIDRTYKPDAYVEIDGGDAVYLEIKPRGILSKQSVLRSKYEEIGRHLQAEGKRRFGLMEWQWDRAFERNVSLLSRYWNDEPDRHAVQAFEAIGHSEVALGSIFDLIDPSDRRAVWAALGRQHLVADLTRSPISHRTLVSMPGDIYKPVDVERLVTEWWA